MKIKRYLIISDVLLSISSKMEDQRWFPPQIAAINWLEKKIGAVTHHRFDWSGQTLRAFDKSTGINYLRMLEKASELAPFEAIIGAGNYTIGIRESGMITEECVAQFETFELLLQQIFGNTRRILAPGGHDVGYRYFLKDRTLVLKIGNETGGLSEKSIDAYQDYVGAVYGLRDLGNIRVLFISSGLIRNVYYDKSPLRLQVMRNCQYDFLKRTLEGIDNSKPTFLVMHDPTALPLSPLTTDLLWRHRSKISAIIHGHSRARFVASLTKINSFYRNLCRDFQVICNPAPAGMFGIGKGFSILECDEEGHWEVRCVPL